MKTFSVLEIVGKNCITIEDGQKVFELVSPFVEKNEKVELDFSSVSTIASPFFNFCIGTLLTMFSLEDVQNCLEISNLSSSGQEVLARVIENSSRFNSLNADARKAMEEQFFEQANSD